MFLLYERAAKLMRYANTSPCSEAIVIEKGKTSRGADVPDLPGCVAVGETIGEVRELIQEAIEFHLEGLKEDELLVPVPVSICESVETN